MTRKLGRVRLTSVGNALREGEAGGVPEDDVIEVWAPSGEPLDKARRSG